MNNKDRIIRYALAASILLNIAFIGGFAYRRLFATNDQTTTQNNDYTSGYEKIGPGKKAIGKGYRHGFKKLHASNEEFRCMDEDYKKKYNGLANKVVQIKKSLLEELKKEPIDENQIKVFESQINTLTEEMTHESTEHLKKMKKVLLKDQYLYFINRMQSKLEKHK